MGGKIKMNNRIFFMGILERCFLIVRLNVLFGQDFTHA